MKLEHIKDYVQDRMSKARYRHTVGVMETAKRLAVVHGVDPEAAQVAALIHDVAKEQSSHQIKAMLKLKYETDILQYDERLWHGVMGAIVAADVLGILNKDVVSAVRFHTTGRPGMSELEKVLFVSDYIEPNRASPGCVKVRELYQETGDLDRAVYEILTHHSIAHPDIEAARSYYKEKVGL